MDRWIVERVVHFAPGDLVRDRFVHFGFVGDRFNHVVRMIEGASGLIRTIAGRTVAEDELAHHPGELDPLRLNLPQISSMDDSDGRLLVPTELDDGGGDLAVLRVAAAA